MPIGKAVGGTAAVSLATARDMTSGGRLARIDGPELAQATSARLSPAQQATCDNFA
jgi:hypothetical protein